MHLLDVLSDPQQLLARRTNFTHCRVGAGTDLAPWLEQVGFPSHALIVRPNQGEGAILVRKGLHTAPELQAALAEARHASADGLALVETDMRGGKVTAIVTSTPSADGKSIAVSVDNKLKGNTGDVSFYRFSPLNVPRVQNRNYTPGQRQETNDNGGEWQPVRAARNNTVRGRYASAVGPVPTHHEVTVTPTTAPTRGRGNGRGRPSTRGRVAQA